MKALTLWQPWASLVAQGIKRIETRSWSTSYRGPLAIHAAAVRHPVPAIWAPGDEGIPFSARRLPLGAVVATCELVDVVPIGDQCALRTGYMEGDEGDLPGRPVVVFHAPIRGSMSEYPEEPALVLDHDGCQTDITDQLPYGDFSCGRFAWLLADVKRLDEPVPARGRQGLWGWLA